MSLTYTININDGAYIYSTSDNKVESINIESTKSENYQISDVTLYNVGSDFKGNIDVGMDITIAINGESMFAGYISDIQITGGGTIAYKLNLIGKTFNLWRDFIPQSITGSGTENDPYRIFNWQNLYNVRDNLGSYYILMNDLDLNTYDYDDYASSSTDSGAGWEPIGTEASKFTGNFNGNNFTIGDVYINRASIDSVGVFGRTESVTLSSINLSGGNITGKDFVGHLCGRCDSGTITNCNSINSNINSSSGYIGGLVGYMDYFTVSNCFTNNCDVISTIGVVGGLIGSCAQNGDVSNCYSINSSIIGTGTYSGGFTGSWYNGTCSDCYTNNTVTGNGIVGGFSGYNQGTINDCYATGNVTNTSTYTGGFLGQQVSGTIRRCYATGNVSGVARTGGFIGSNNANIINCYAKGNVTRYSGSSTYIGGFVGVHNQGTINYCYSIGSVEYIGASNPSNKGFTGYGYLVTETGDFWDTQTSNQSTSDGDATGKTTAEMHTLSTFTDASWDIVDDQSYTDEVWKIDSGNAYPELGWE